MFEERDEISMGARVFECEAREREGIESVSVSLLNAREEDRVVADAPYKPAFLLEVEASVKVGQTREKVTSRWSNICFVALLELGKSHVSVTRQTSCRCLTERTLSRGVCLTFKALALRVGKS